MKYKNKFDFAEKVINKMPFVRSMNIKVRVGESSIGFTAIKGVGFFGGREITTSFMDNLHGIINGLVYAHEELKGGK